MGEKFTTQIEIELEEFWTNNLDEMLVDLRVHETVGLVSQRYGELLKIHEKFSHVGPGHV